MKEFVKGHALLIGGLGIGIASLLILGMALSCLLIVMIKWPANTVQGALKNVSRLHDDASHANSSQITRNCIGLCADVTNKIVTFIPSLYTWKQKERERACVQRDHLARVEHTARAPTFTTSVVGEENALLKVSTSLLPFDLSGESRERKIDQPASDTKERLRSHQSSSSDTSLVPLRVAWNIAPLKMTGFLSRLPSSSEARHEPAEGLITSSCVHFTLFPVSLSLFACVDHSPQLWPFISYCLLSLSQSHLFVSDIIGLQRERTQVTFNTYSLIVGNPFYSSHQQLTCPKINTHTQQISHPKLWLFKELYEH